MWTRWTRWGRWAWTRLPTLPRRIEIVNLFTIFRHICEISLQNARKSGRNVFAEP